MFSEHANSDMKLTLQSNLLSSQTPDLPKESTKSSK